MTVAGVDAARVAMRCETSGRGTRDRPDASAPGYCTTSESGDR